MIANSKQAVQNIDARLQQYPQLRSQFLAFLLFDGLLLQLPLHDGPARYSYALKRLQRAKYLLVDGSGRFDPTYSGQVKIQITLGTMPLGRWRNRLQWAPAS